MLVLKTVDEKKDYQEPQEVKQHLVSITLIENKNDLSAVKSYIYERNIKHVFVDTETTGLDVFGCNLILLQIYAGSRIFIIHIDRIGTQSTIYNCIKEIMEDEAIVKIFHNGIFDIKFLKYHLWSKKCRFRNLFDTFIAEHLLTAGISKKGDYSLKALAKKYVHIEIDKTAQKSFKKGEELTTTQIDYAAWDVRVLEPIFKEQAGLLSKENQAQCAMLEFSIIPAVANIELNGVRLDVAKCGQMKATLEVRLRTLGEGLRHILKEFNEGHQENLLDESSINFNSPIQVKNVLFQLGYSVESTRTEVIEKIDHPFTQTLVEHRKVSKLITSFADKLPYHIHQKTGRIHPEFMQVGTDAGRFTCQNPNLQQIPKEQEWRDLFIAPCGYKIITADYSQIELRILAEYSKDEVFLKAYKEGQDLHQITASQMFQIDPAEVTKEQRNIAKVINFGLCYGMSAKGLSARLDIPLEKAERFINAYFKAYPQVKSTLQRLGIFAITHHYSETLLGRKRYYLPANSFTMQKSIERKGRNTPIQGTCGDILKKAIFYLSEDLDRYDANIINLVHDEVVVECVDDQTEEVLAIIRTNMIKAGQDFIKSVPIEVEIGIDDMWRK